MLGDGAMVATKTQRLLIVDDDSEIGATVVEIAIGLGIEARAVSNQYEFKYVYNLFKPTIVCLDVEMPGAGDAPLITWITDIPPAPKVILTADRPEILQTVKSLAEFVGLTVIAVVEKPVAIDALHQTLATAVGER